MGFPSTLLASCLLMCSEEASVNLTANFCCMYFPLPLSSLYLLLTSLSFVCAPVKYVTSLSLRLHSFENRATICVCTLILYVSMQTTRQRQTLHHACIIILIKLAISYWNFIRCASLTCHLCMHVRTNMFPWKRGEIVIITSKHCSA
jgi:hypothetical protein